MAITERTEDRADRVDAIPPALPSVFEPDEAAGEAARAMGAAMGFEHGSDDYVQAADEYRLMTLKSIHDRITLDHRFDLGWPNGLYIPSAADEHAWPFFGPAKRYTNEWTADGPGWGTAKHADGSLFTVASSPTVKGAIDGKCEAGLGFIFTATDQLARLRIEPELAFIGRHQWNVAPPPTVWTTTRVVGTLLVGGFQLDPVTNQWGPLPSSPWRRHVVFDRYNPGSGGGAIETYPFNRSGAQAAVDVLAEGGRTYLLAVVAQVAIRITTTDSGGNHVNVATGTFDTWGSLAGVVRQIWLDKTVYIA
jgi:hypothetical protein